jgi:ankyrin repeat protein
MTPAMLAAKRGDDGFLELLVQHGADLELTSRDGLKAIDYARKFGQLPTVGLLTVRMTKSRSSEKDPSSRTPSSGSR